MEGIPNSNGTIFFPDPEQPVDLSIILPELASMPGPIHSGPGVADPQDWPAEDSELYLKLSEPSGSGSVP